ncbi:hypothetical protein Pla144_31110 [Bythopirellula polymerisocia]|uniref:Uncharacterized protein n=2 Tax=Bythopirellula polymerisocia TaxID=2528003 RepID=A0A5C6CQT4_9BACT|nr:hypothetical protein Pla144_31110 [Bythopirellula polymerisocia]
MSIIATMKNGIVIGSSGRSSVHEVGATADYSEPLPRNKMRKVGCDPPLLTYCNQAADLWNPQRLNAQGLQSLGVDLK